MTDDEIIVAIILILLVAGDVIVEAYKLWKKL